MFHMPYGKSHYDGSILKAEFIAVLTSSLLLNDPTPCIQLPSSVHIHFNFNLNLNRQSKMFVQVYTSPSRRLCALAISKNAIISLPYSSTVVS